MTFFTFLRFLSCCTRYLEDWAASHARNTEMWPITTNVAWNAWPVCLLSQCSNETADVILLRPIGLWPILRKL